MASQTSQILYENNEYIDYNENIILNHNNILNHNVFNKNLEQYITKIVQDRLIKTQYINEQIIKMTAGYIEKKFVEKFKLDIKNMLSNVGEWENEIDKDYFFSHCPGLTEDAAKYLIDKKVNAVGIDSPSIDRGSESSFAVHKLLLSNEILIVENLCNLDKLNCQYFTLIMTPLKLSGASGSPIRAIAVEKNVLEP